MQRKAAFILGILLATTFLCSAIDKRWTGGVSTDWFEPNNWEPPGIPAPEDTAFVQTNNIVYLGFDVVLNGLNLDGPSTTLDGPGNLTVTNFNWTNGFLRGAGACIIPAGGTLWLHPGTRKELYRSMTNFGTVIQAGFFHVVAPFHNAGAFEMRGDTSIGGFFGGLFKNIGLFSKTQGLMTNIFGIPFDNRGEMTLLSGTLRLSNHTNEGVVNISEGATLEVPRFPVIAPSCSLRGSGTLRFGGYCCAFAPLDTVVLTTNPIHTRIEIIKETPSLVSRPVVRFDSTVSVNECFLDGGTISGSNSVTITNLIWSEGFLGGGGTIVIPPSGKFLISGTELKMIWHRNLFNEGLVEWQHNILLYPETFNVINHGLFDFTGDGGWRVNTGAFLNYGTVRKSEGTGKSHAGASFTNYGRVEVRTGTLAPGTRHFIQHSGEVILNGGTLDAYYPAALHVYGGKVEGAGTITGHEYYGNLINVGGNINPGSPIGTLTVAGYFGSAGFLNVDIGGVIPGVDHDTLVVTGEVRLLFSAALRLRLVNGFKPRLGDRFEVLKSLSRPLVEGNRSTGFSLTGGTDLGDGLMLLPQYGTTNLVMVVTNSLPNPSNMALAPEPRGVFSPTYRVRFHTSFATNYVIQASSTLTNWIDLSISPGPIDFIDFIDWNSQFYSSRFYRLRWGE